MRTFFRWVAKIIGNTIAVILVIVLFPYASRIVEKVMPDESATAIKTSMVLAAKLENSSRLETLKVSEDGALHYDIRAAFLGTVGTVDAAYRYEASFGIDLSKVMMNVKGNKILFILPSPEIIQDTLTPSDVYHDDFWYKGFTFDDYEKLLEDERLERRAVYLSGDKTEMLWDATVAAFEKTIAQWMNGVNGHLVFEYVEASTTENVLPE